MHNDSVTWEILGQGKCSFKKKTEKQMFCLNDYNVTGLCTKVNCPLSNSVYGTVLLDKGEIYLYLKCPEKAHLPSELWSKTLLSLNKKESFNIIYKEMKHTHNIKQIKKCMKRYIRIKEILKRSRKLVLQKQLKLTPIKKKTERRNKIREGKALKAANILNTVETELINRLNTGVYGNLYKFLTPKKKVKNKESELTKIFSQIEVNNMGKKKKKHLDEEMEEIEEEDDDGDEDETDDDGDEDDDDDGDEDEIDGDEDDDDDGDEDDDDEDDDDDDEDDEEEKIMKKEKKKKKKYVKEYVDNEYIKKLQEEGKISDGNETEDVDNNFPKRAKKRNNGSNKKKKIRIAYENE
ncbi:protein MAK16, putative [Plasmodium berghei]|uniref:Protein MAK16 homolog n=2 Tax=Plasmodium berghei TaxID=5821 RepID=A0A509AEI0_PLABA|nr:protein MAK16, putative [Plasmodium berghei ANKA]SCL90617.1 protein MAK16, putative [Plasmodium berghei]SCM15316.1 protein MAK16, putative [Plasmodium berghei]SCN22087.1 protein MAK16, putative [Plasmodium berghei]VUC54054.1 protein MAK16, putative [Plasmodium berghei ANKA]|eukprot:XP_034419899.1 protein MAK16, putative [Plasmodium berghei ANKA]